MTWFYVFATLVVSAIWIGVSGLIFARGVVMYIHADNLRWPWYVLVGLLGGLSFVATFFTMLLHDVT